MPNQNGMIEIFLSLVSKYSAKDLKEAAYKNTSLKMYIYSDPKIASIVPMAKMFAFLNKKHSGELTAYNVAVNMIDKRPDLANAILMDMKIRNWLDAQITQLKPIFGL